MKDMKSYKKELIAAFAIGIIVLFGANNWTTQEAYDVISCTYNQNDCAGLQADGWDGICTQEILDECCSETDMCNGQVVANPYDCYHYYCTDSAKFCDADYDMETEEFTCTCADIWQDI